MNKIQIDGWLYYLPSTNKMASTRQLELYRIIRAIASAGGKVRSHELMRFLGLRTMQPYEFRMKRLIEQGYLERA
jgi:predicted transcriptional regulator